MLVLTRQQVDALLDPDELVAALERAQRELSAGRASMPQRTAALVEERDALLGVMPAYVDGTLAVKLVTVFPHNTDRPTHQAAIMVFSAESGEPLALLDGTAITAARTAAGSALATKLMAREDSGTLAILGTGVQARSHARALARVRDFREIRVAGRDPGRTRALADELGAVACASWEEALEGADVVAATTHATEPVVRREWLAAGTHVNSIGLNPHGHEVDEKTVRDALVVVESRAAALAPFPTGAPELAGLDPQEIHAELGELVSGARPGRTAADQLTLYKSVGVAVQDVAAAALVLAAAQRSSTGTEIQLEEQ